MKSFKEKDMYPPVKDFFQAMGFSVFGEVKDCDIAMKKDDELIIIELKRHFSVDLLMQAIQRQKITHQVFIAIPRPKKAKGKKYKSTLELVKKLDLGLIFVAMDTSYLVDIVLYPENTPNKIFTKSHQRKRQALLTEMENRTGDYNIGGSTRTPIVTAFRESNIKIAMALFLEGPLSPKELRERFNCHKDCGHALYRNYYGWFHRVSHGQYMLADGGFDMIEHEYPALIAYYKEEIEKMLTLEALKKQA